MAERYPTDIVTHKGHGRIHVGHDLDEAMLLADMRHASEPRVSRVETESVDLVLHRRVKNCDAYGGPCDLEGDWHGHWEGVRPAPGTAFTIAYPVTSASEKETNRG